MTRSDREHRAKRIVRHYTTIANQQTAPTVNHFLAENVPRQTIYNIIRKYEASGIVGDKPRSGRPRKMPSGQRTLLRRLVNHHTDVSLRKIALKFGVRRRTIQRDLKAMNIIYRKKKRAPRYTEKQIEEGITRTRRLYITLLNGDLDLIMDDEKYFTLTKDTVSTNRVFYTSDLNITPLNMKFKSAQKYSTKVLIWAVVSEKKTSEPFFAEQKQAINEPIYFNHCIKARLIPFINYYHKSNKVLFWPDMATSHYVSSVAEFLEDQNSNLVSKEKIRRIVLKYAL